MQSISTVYAIGNAHIIFQEYIKEFSFANIVYPLSFKSMCDVGQIKDFEFQIHKEILIYKIRFKQLVFLISS